MYEDFGCLLVAAGGNIKQRTAGRLFIYIYIFESLILLRSPHGVTSLSKLSELPLPDTNDDALFRLAMSEACLCLFLLMLVTILQTTFQLQ